jgi:hypothetical protein
LREQLAANGYAILPAVYTPAQIDVMLLALESTLQRQPAASTMRTESGSIYAARNVLTLWPDAAMVWRQSPLPATLMSLLGVQFGLVRILFFDKPPDRTWALPWHKDLTIAVQNNHLPSHLFSKPTLKAGVPHVEAPVEVLEQMLTVRIHLDDVTDENGPLKVIPGSHRTGKELRLGDVAPQAVLCQRGDVLLMRPLLAHASGHSEPATHRHRRVLHLEFAGTSELPDGYSWHDFRPVNA